jgi:hypothetical protein
MTSSASRPRRWGLIIPWAIAGLIVVGWCGYWFALRTAVETALNDWSRTQEEATGRGGFASAAIGGFPLRLEARLTAAAAVDPRGGYEASTPLALVAINPVNPQHVIVSLPQPVSYRLQGGGERLMTGTRVEASIRLEGERLARISFAGEGLRLALPNAPADQGLRFAALGVHIRPDARNAADWQVAIQGAGVRLASPVRAFEALGQELSAMTLGVVVAKAEALIEGSAPDPLELWRQAGGETRLEAAEVTWGPLTATGDGLIRLDEGRRLQGALNVRPSDTPAFLEAVAGGGDNPLTAILAQSLEISTVTLTAQDGVLSWQADTPLGAISPQPLRTLGPVYEPASSGP